MQRQVTTICPKTGRTVWTYEDLGARAAKPRHGHADGQRRRAVGPEGFIAPKIARTTRTV